MKLWNKKSVKIVSLALAGTLCVSTVSVLAYSAGANSSSPEADVKEKIAEKASNIIDKDRTVGKDETVYVLSGADGSTQKIIVSDWLKNGAGESALSDYTELEDVVNVKGEEGFSLNSDNTRVWDAQGNDIYYQGTINKQLPVTIRISYTLDGERISPDELAGKSGKVTIRFDYVNNQKETVVIDGKEETMYVPFVIVTGMILDNEKFSNIEVSNGKLVNDGDRIAVMGFALPGMQENLKLDKEKLEIPSYVEITADTEDFELTTTLSVATNEVFNNLNLDETDSVGDLTDALSELSDASGQLVDGSSELYEGLSMLLDKSGEMVAGIDKLYEGEKQVKNGANSLKEGSAQLEAGVSELNAGLKTLASNNSELTGGAKQVFDSLLKMADEQLAASGLTVPKLTVDNYKTTLNSVLRSLDKNTIYNMAYNTALDKVTAAVKAQESTIRSQVEAAVRVKVLEGVLAASGQPMTSEEYKQAAAAGLITEEQQAQIEAAVTARMGSSEVRAQIDSAVQAKIKELIAANMKSSDVQSQINAAVSQAQSGSNSITALITQLDSYKKFYQGVLDYTSGVSSAYEGSGKLVTGSGKLTDGASALASGADSLYDGLGTLKSGTPALVDGITQLKDGAMQLSEGMLEFDEQGIQKLVNALDGDLDGLVSRLKAMVNVSKDYQSFAGIKDGVNGSVKFIFKTDAVEKDA